MLAQPAQAIDASLGKPQLRSISSEKAEIYYMYNPIPGPIEVAVYWEKRQNSIAQPQLPNHFIVPYGNSPALFMVFPADRSQPIQYAFQYSYILGRVLTNYQSKLQYRPPIAPHARFQISQAFNGSVSHTDQQNRYAVDIMMPFNSPVFAAHDGIVLEIEDDYPEAAPLPKITEANNIRVLHKDGSMAVYAHLASDSAQVKLGSSVIKGQLLAYTGNSGLLNGPHLHFAVQINQGMELVSVPFEFIDANDQLITPETGLWLQGYE